MERSTVLNFTWYGWRPEIVFLDLIVPHVPEKAQNGNRDSIQAYQVFSPVPVTGLIGALLTTYFQKIGIWTQNSE